MNEIGTEQKQDTFQSSPSVDEALPSEIFIFLTP